MCIVVVCESVKASARAERVLPADPGVTVVPSGGDRFADRSHELTDLMSLVHCGDYSCRHNEHSAPSYNILIYMNAFSRQQHLKCSAMARDAAPYTVLTQPPPSMPIRIGASIHAVRQILRALRLSRTLEVQRLSR